MERRAGQAKSNLAHASHSVLIEPRDLTEGELPKASRVKADKLATLGKALVRRRFGAVKPAVLRMVLKELQSVLAGP